MKAERQTPNKLRCVDLQHAIISCGPFDILCGGSVYASLSGTEDYLEACVSEHTIHTS